MHTKTTLLLILIEIIILILGQSSCPNNCNGHGTCSGTKCTCQESWIGEDCSIPLETLQSGIQKQGSVDRWSWHFYVISNPLNNGAIRVDIDPPDSGINGDCDIFIRRGSIPTSTEWDVANIDWGTKASLIIEEAAPDRYYIGVYANFITCKYYIKATVGNCPIDCGSHGHCETIFNVPTCVCDSEWSGSTCTDKTEQILINKEKSGHLDQNQWIYYFVVLSENVTQLVIDVNITNASPELHDCDLYVKYNQLPSFVAWDYKDNGILTHYNISIPSPQQGKWFLALWGYKDCDYKLILKTIKGECVAECSKHGTCGPPCSCSADYSGSACETKKTPLRIGEKVSGYVAQNTWNYYRYQSISLQTNIVIQVEQHETPANADCDLYVRNGVNPTRFNFDYLEISRQSSYDLVISDALHDVLYLGVYGWFPCSYSLNVTESQKCTDGCGHGNCTNQGICICNDGWFGRTCNQQGNSLTSGTKYRGKIENANDWKYFYYSAKKSTLIVSLKEIGAQSASAGLLFLFISENTAPTLREYDYNDVDFNKAFHSITIPLEDRTVESEWVIGVYGSASVENGQGIEFDIVAWEPTD